MLINAGQANAATVSLMLSISRDLELCCLRVNTYDSDIA